MSEETKTINVVVASVEEAVMEKALQDLGGALTGSTATQVIPLQGITIRVQPVLSPEENKERWDTRRGTASAVALLVRHGDYFTMEAHRKILKTIGESPVPVAVVVYRETDASDFKISCPECGQKLWVSDNDADKRGRCPNCQKPFTISDPARHVRVELGLPKDTTIVLTQEGNPIAIQAAIVNLVRPIVGEILQDEDFLVGEVISSNTVRVQVQNGE